MADQSPTLPYTHALLGPNWMRSPPPPTTALHLLRDNSDLSSGPPLLLPVSDSASLLPWVWAPWRVRSFEFPSVKFYPEYKYSLGGYFFPRCFLNPLFPHRWHMSFPVSSKAPNKIWSHNRALPCFILHINHLCYRSTVPTPTRSASRLQTPPTQGWSLRRLSLISPRYSAWICTYNEWSIHISWQNILHWHVLKNWLV